MEKKNVKEFVYKGLGFPVFLKNVILEKRRDVWTPAIDFNKLQRQVLATLSKSSLPLTGHQVHFIRAYFEMTLEIFGKKFGTSEDSVLDWEKNGNQSANIDPTTEMSIRIFINDATSNI